MRKLRGVEEWSILTADGTWLGSEAMDTVEIAAGFGNSRNSLFLVEMVVEAWDESVMP